MQRRQQLVGVGGRSERGDAPRPGSSSLSEDERLVCSPALTSNLRRLKEQKAERVDLWNRTGSSRSRCHGLFCCCRDKLWASGREPELLFVKDKWKSRGAEGRSHMERDPPPPFCPAEEALTTPLYPTLGDRPPAPRAPSPCIFLTCTPPRLLSKLCGPCTGHFDTVHSSWQPPLPPSLPLSPRLSPFPQYRHRAEGASRDLLAVREERQGGLGGREDGRRRGTVDNMRDSDSYLLITFALFGVELHLITEISTSHLSKSHRILFSRLSFGS